LATRDVPIMFCPTKAISATAVNVKISPVYPKGAVPPVSEWVFPSIEVSGAQPLRAFDKSDNGDEDDCAYDRGDD
jgi:hypothetical protein